MFKRQFKHAVRLPNPPMIRTHEVEDDTQRTSRGGDDERVNGSFHPLCYPSPSSYKPIPLALIHVHLCSNTLELSHLPPIHHKLHLWKSQWKIKVHQGCWWRRNGQVSVSLGKSWSPIPRRSCTSSVEEGELRSACQCWYSRLAPWGSVLTLPLLTPHSCISRCSPQVPRC